MVRQIICPFQMPCAVLYIRIPLLYQSAFLLVLDYFLKSLRDVYSSGASSLNWSAVHFKLSATAVISALDILNLAFLLYMSVVPCFGC